MFHPRISALRKRRHQRGGFALAELLIAAVFLAFALAAFFQVARIGDWQNLHSRIQARLGRVIRRYSDFVAYAPYDRLSGGELENGYLYHPLQVTSTKDYAALPDPDKATYLDAFPYRVECTVTKFNVGTASEYANVRILVYYFGQKDLSNNNDLGEKLAYDNGGLIRTRY